MSRKPGNKNIWRKSTANEHNTTTTTSPRRHLPQPTSSIRECRQSTLSLNFEDKEMNNLNLDDGKRYVVVVVVVVVVVNFCTEKETRERGEGEREFRRPKPTKIDHANPYSRRPNSILKLLDW